MIIATREQKRRLERDNAKLPNYLEVIPKHLHPATGEKNRIQAWRSRSFLVQAFGEGEGLIRLSVNRTTLGDNGRWLENISWDELMQLKREAGFGDWYAIEVYPRDKDVVNVANMRHLWVMEKPLNIGWFKNG
jgi:hypothetical protein